MTTDPIPPDRPTSWRDVYTLVQDVEQRITDRLADAVSTNRQTTADHEARLRVIEATVTPIAQAANVVASANAIRITALEAANVVKGARQGGQASVFTYGQKVIVAAVIIANAVTTIFALLSR